MAGEDRELKDITGCCICFDVLQDPKILPCIHTFCMNCLQQTGLQSNKSPGDQMPCPICRRPFTIPKEGFTALPNNTFIERLITVRKLLNPRLSKVLCDACTEETKSDSTKEVVIVDMYCVDCREKLCESCFKRHRKFKLTKGHKLISLSQQDPFDHDLIADLAPCVCALHKHTMLDIYCFNCNKVVCNICFIESHKNHDGKHVHTIADKFRKDIESCIENVNDWRLTAQNRRTELDTEKQLLDEKTQDVANEILQRKEKLESIVNKNVCFLTDKLDSLKHERLKEVEVEIEENDLFLVTLDSYSQYCRNILTKGSASDICRASGDLSARAVEIENQAQPLQKPRNGHFEITFEKRDLNEFSQQGVGFVGDIAVADVTSTKPHGVSVNSGDGIKNTGELDMEHATQRSQTATLKKESDAQKYALENAVMSKEKLSDKLAISQLQENNGKLQQELETQYMAMSQLYASSDSLQQELHEKNVLISQLQEKGNKLQEELEKNKWTIIRLKPNFDKVLEDFENSKMTNSHLQAMSERLQKELDDANITITGLQSTSDTLQQELDNKNLAISQLQENSDNLQQELDKKNLTISQLQENSDELQQELDKKNLTISQLQRSSDNLQQELDKKNLTISQLQGGSDNLQQELDKKNLTISQLQGSSDNLQQELDKKNLTISQLQGSSDKLQEELEKKILAVSHLQQALVSLG